MLSNYQLSVEYDRLEKAYVEEQKAKRIAELVSRTTVELETQDQVNRLIEYMRTGNLA